ncbi:MAG: ABC transporter ATP-binding protein [Pseudomonadales bacterium]|jgi:ATP-binding cassette subfamily B protein|nr:ABC transporter ATP-binding protein [Pseudomonadales bacterium]MDP6470487.1 ABC transporter ATP-binding protein [Pseudomonadales bacterium]MDP6827789.1 ABC transporter ATP-binding protein [Pseudomonadales bacterium]MDP6970738.1 ABC transporter ATP-binding protein [Pseudomonadales bacterium]|tara:strand:- start:117 stop:2006 length:1890 start_codon:yes stop_codon:yes gene_type:complete
MDRQRKQPTQRDYSMFDAELSGTVLNMSLLGRLLGWLQPYAVTLTVSAALILLASTLQVLLPIVISLVVIDHIIQGETEHLAPDLGMIDATEWIAATLDVHVLLAACVLYATLQIAWAFTGHAHRMTLISSVIKALRDLRLDLFRHLETRPASFYDRVAVGRVMTRVTNDVEALYELLRGVGTLIGEFVPFFVALAIMLAIDVQLTLILLLALPIMGTVTFFFRRATRTLFRLVRMSISALNQNMQENLSGLQVVQISERQDYNLNRYTRINLDNLEHELKSARVETLYGAFTDSMAHVAIGVIIWYGAGAVIQDHMSLGGVILFTRFIDMLFHPIVALGEQTNILFRAMASGERIFQALDWDEKIHEPVEPALLPERLQGEVEFRHVDFGYDHDMQILQNVSFTIAPGEKLAIVGPTGSGKSTMIRLLGRFYDFDDNQIFLDGIDLNRIHTHDLRHRVGVVLQDFHIFSGSIFENIALGDARIDLNRAMEAARTVNAHTFIETLPNDYHTELSERGQNLSQGQRQLLAFARVLAADPEILVLDEATASIDTETELLIQDGLRKLTAGRTSILIAHRLQTIQEADRILVLHHGRVEELGTHQELLAEQGLYYQLHMLQFQEMDEITASD